MQGRLNGDRNTWILQQNVIMHCWIDITRLQFITDKVLCLYIQLCNLIEPFKVQRSLYKPHSGHYVYHTAVNICTASKRASNSTFCPHSVFMCFVWIWEQTATTSLYSTNWLVFITETQCVYCSVRTGSLYTASLTFSNSTFCPHSVFMCFVWIWEQTAIISLYSINWLVFITETECVYCAVWTGSLYTASLTFSNSTFCPHSVFMCFV